MSKILIISPFGTHPPDEGNRQRALSLADAMAALGHEVHVAVLPNRKFDAGDAEAMRAYWDNRVHLLYPFRDWTPGFRIRRLLAPRLVPGLRKALDIAPPSPRIPSIDDFYFAWWDLELIFLQRRHRFDTVIAEYVFVSRALLNFPPTVRKLIDTHDIFSGRDESLRAKRDIRSDWLSTDRESEGRGLDRADVVIAIQENEADKLRRFTMKPVVTVGYFAQIARPTRSDTGEARSVILFVGADNAINLDGCSWFIDTVLDRVIAAVPRARLRIVGGVSDRIRDRYGLDERLEVIGRVESLNDEYAVADVVINPVQWGTGLAIKSIEALAYGAALVCTPEGARGLSLALGEPSPCPIARTSEAFAEQVVEILTTPELRDRYRRAGLDFVDAWNRRQAANLAEVVGP